MEIVWIDFIIGFDDGLLFLIQLLFILLAIKRIKIDTVAFWREWGGGKKIIYLVPVCG